VSYHQAQALGAEGDACASAAATAAESSRVALTMVRALRAGGSPEKTAQINQLLRDWSTGTGESFEAMLSRWQAKAAADAAASRAAAAAAAESSRVALTMVTCSKRPNDAGKRNQAAQLLRDWGSAGETFATMMARWQAKAATDAATARTAAAAAAESSRVSLTMVRARDLPWSVEKDRQKAQLRRDWSTGTGESFEAMMSRWQAKAAADAAAAKTCGEAPALPIPDAGGGAPSAPPGTEAPEAAGGGGFLGLPIWAWGAGSAVVLIGGALVLRRMKSKKAAAT
jgi:hypothetical protein